MKNHHFFVEMSIQDLFPLLIGLFGCLRMSCMSCINLLSDMWCANVLFFIPTLGAEYLVERDGQHLQSSWFVFSRMEPLFPKPVQRLSWTSSLCSPCPRWSIHLVSSDWAEEGSPSLLNSICPELSLRNRQLATR